jgi:hypothetical protein
MITEIEIKLSEKFFNENDESVLREHAKTVNTHQPAFSAVFGAMEMHGVDGYKVDDLFRSVFVINYIYTIIKKINIRRISSGQIEKNIRLFENFIEFFNKEKNFEENIDLKKITFLTDETTLFYAVKILLQAFGDIKNIPNVVLFPYFALLKAIETGAVKSIYNK